MDITCSCRRARHPPFRTASAPWARVSQEEPLTGIVPGQHADLCSSGSGGEVAYMHVTRNDQSGLTMNITIWQYTP